MSQHRWTLCFCQPIDPATFLSCRGKAGASTTEICWHFKTAIEAFSEVYALSKKAISELPLSVKFLNL